MGRRLYTYGTESYISSNWDRIRTEYKGASIKRVEIQQYVMAGYIVARWTGCDSRYDSCSGHICPNFVTLILQKAWGIFVENLLIRNSCFP